MRVSCIVLLTLASLGDFSRLESAQPTSREIIEKAIAAHYGTSKITKPKGIQLDIKGKVTSPLPFKVTRGTVFMLPGRYRYELDIEVNRNNVSLIKVFDGEDIWVRTKKTTKIKDKKQVQQSKGSVHAEGVSSLLPLRQKKYKLSPLGELDIKGTPTIGVRVSCKGHADVGLYFDKKTFLLRKVDFNNLDPFKSQQVLMERFYSGYKQLNGIAAPTRLVVHGNGSPYAKYEISSFEFVDRMDATLFEKP